jgi:hypothetical protein
VQAATKAAVVLSKKRFFMVTPIWDGKKFKNDKQNRCHYEGAEEGVCVPNCIQLMPVAHQLKPLTPCFGALALQKVQKGA